MTELRLKRRRTRYEADVEDGFGIPASMLYQHPVKTALIELKIFPSDAWSIGIIDLIMTYAHGAVVEMVMDMLHSNPLGQSENLISLLRHAVAMVRRHQPHVFTLNLTTGPMVIMRREIIRVGALGEDYDRWAGFFNHYYVAVDHAVIGIYLSIDYQNDNDTTLDYRGDQEGAIDVTALAESVGFGPHLYDRFSDIKEVSSNKVLYPNETIVECLMRHVIPLEVIVPSDPTQSIASPVAEEPDL